MKRIILISLIILSLVACSKNTDKFTPYSENELNDVNWSNTGVAEAKAAQIVGLLSKANFTANFNVNNGAELDVNNNIQLIMPVGSYLLNGNNYTNGNIKVSLKQILSKGDFIRNLMSTNSSDALQEAKGAFLLKLTDDNGNNLSLKQNAAFNLRLFDSVLSQNYQFYYGLASSYSEGNVHWNVADSIATGSLQTSQFFYQGTYKNALEVTSKNLNWINIAQPLSFTNYTSASVVMPQNFTNKTTFVFAVFNDKNVVITFSPDYNTKTFIAKKIPVGANMKLISISLIDNQFYLGSQDINITNSNQYSLKPSLTPITLSNLNIFLDGL